MKDLLKKLEFIEKKFDVIMFYHVIEHFFDQTKTFEILKKRLKKNGILILGTPLIGTLISNILVKIIGSTILLTQYYLI